MKKFLKVLLALVIALVIIGGVTFLIDASRIRSEKAPIFVLKGSQIQDGGTTEYIGLGYKVIDFNMINGYNGVIMGPWTMNFDEQYQKYGSQRIEKLNEEIITPVEEKPIEETTEMTELENPNGEEMSNEMEGTPEDIVAEGEMAGENLTEGETAAHQTAEGVTETEMPEEATVENPAEVENPTEIENEIPAGEQVQEIETTKPTITAIVMGVNGNEIVARVESFVGIESQVDMIAFVNADESKTFAKDQRISIEFDGTLSGEYPARINAEHVEIIG